MSDKYWLPLGEWPSLKWRCRAVWVGHGRCYLGVHGGAQHRAGDWNEWEDFVLQPESDSLKEGAE